MILVNILLVLALVSSFVYMILGLLAYSHQRKESGIDKGWVLSPIWALFPDSYDESGQKLCVTGKMFFWISTIFTLFWLLMDYCFK